MRRRSSRKDSDLTGVVDLRYTGGARLLLMLELGGGRWRFRLPVLVSELDLECKMWIKVCCVCCARACVCVGCAGGCV